jgi:lactoylglutathione lyase
MTEPAAHHPDHGFTHVALTCNDLASSIAFYGRYAEMRVVHERHDPGGNAVAWLSDGTRPFVIVLIESPGWMPRWLLALARRVGFLVGHLGVGVRSRAAVDAAAAQARGDGCLQAAPRDFGPPVGYFALLTDPDGHTLELAHGQEVGLAVARSTTAHPPPC